MLMHSAIGNVNNLITDFGGASHTNFTVLRNPNQVSNQLGSASVTVRNVFDQIKNASTSGIAIAGTLWVLMWGRKRRPRRSHVSC